MERNRPKIDLQISSIHFDDGFLPRGRERERGVLIELTMNAIKKVKPARFSTS